MVETRGYSYLAFPTNIFQWIYEVVSSIDSKRRIKVQKEKVGILITNRHEIVITSCPNINPHGVALGKFNCTKYEDGFRYKTLDVYSPVGYGHNWFASQLLFVTVRYFSRKKDQLEVFINEKAHVDTFLRVQSVIDPFLYVKKWKYIDDGDHTPTFVPVVTDLYAHTKLNRYRHIIRNPHFYFERLYCEDD